MGSGVREAGIRQVPDRRRRIKLNLEELKRLSRTVRLLGREL